MCCGLLQQTGYNQAGIRAAAVYGSAGALVAEAAYGTAGLVTKGAAYGTAGNLAANPNLPPGAAYDTAGNLIGDVSGSWGTRVWLGPP